jgi:MFS family permease
VSRWTILAVLFTARISVAITFQSVAAILPFLVADLGLTYTQAGTLIGLFMLPGVLLAIPAGWLGARFGDKRVALFGLAAMIAGSVIVAMATTFAEAAVGRMVCGSGAIVLNVLLAKMTTDWFAGREIATAMGILVSSWPIGLALAMAAFGWWATIAGWPAVLHAAAAVSALGLALIALTYSQPPGAATAAPGPAFSIGRRGLELALLAGLVWGTFNASTIIFISFVPTFLIAGGWTAASANGTASLVVWLCTPLVLLGGHVADRTGRGDLLIAGTTLVTGLLMAAMPLVPAPLLILILVGLVWGTCAGPIMAMPQILPAEQRAAGFGVFFTAFYACVAILPPAAGLVLDLAADPAAPLFLAAAIMASTAGIAWLFQRRGAGLEPRAALST